MGLWSKNKVYFGTILGNGSTSSKNVSTAILASDTKGGIYVEEGDHPKHTCEKRSILEQPVFSRKKGSDNRPAINIKNLNIFIPYLHFKMEGLHSLKEMLKEKDNMCKIDLKDAYVRVLLHQKHWKYNWFCWEGQLYEFLSIFRSETSSTNFHEATENPNSDSTKNQHSDHCLPGRYALDEPNNRRPEHGKGHIDFSLIQQLGFIINLKKSVLSATQKLEFLGWK